MEPGIAFQTELIITQPSFQPQPIIIFVVKLSKGTGDSALAGGVVLSISLRVEYPSDLSLNHSKPYFNRI